MTPKQKGNNLVKKSFNIVAKASGYKGIQKVPESEKLKEANKFSNLDRLSKKIAIISVDEIISEYEDMSDLSSKIVVNDELFSVLEKISYWKEVKSEIEKL